MSLLPPNSSPLDRALEKAMQVPAMPIVLGDIWNAQTCPISVLPWLAWSLSIDSWSPDWPEAVQRQRVATAISIQRRKGTAGSIRDIVAIFGGQIAIREWWQTTPKGTPHTFEVNLNLNDADGLPASAERVDSVIDQINRTKPARSHFEFVQGLTATARLGTKAAARVANYTRLSFVIEAA
jgi:phage tail P2-like protein